MIIRIEDLKETCSKILAAVDSNELSVVTETLELIGKDHYLYMNTTNREYYASVKIDMFEPVNFHAAVNANLFLKLISQITTETVEITTTESALVVKANGNYKLPLITDQTGSLISVPEIKIDNVTAKFNIPGETLLSILQYNSKQLAIGTIAKPVQKFYYVDEKGAITFTSGACVNSFALEQPIKILLNNRIVKLFKLFKDENVSFELGYDAISDEIIQTKVSFESNSVKLTAILTCDDTMLNSVPVNAIRGMTDNQYDYCVNLNKDALLQTINRLMLFNSGYGSKENIKPYNAFEFKGDRVVIYDVNRDNHEEIMYTNTSIDTDNCSIILDITEVKAVLESYTESYVNIAFNQDTNSKAIVMYRGNVKNVIPKIS